MTRSPSSPDRRGTWLGDDLAAITLLASLIDQAERCLPELVTNARVPKQLMRHLRGANGATEL